MQFDSDLGQGHVQNLEIKWVAVKWLFEPKLAPRCFALKCNLHKNDSASWI